MGRRGDHGRDELKRMIVNSAIEILEESGFGELSARKVSSRIGYTVGTLYNIFENIDDLLLHVNAFTIDSIYNRFTKIIEKNKNSAELIKLLARDFIDFSNKNFALWSVLFEHRITTLPEFPKWYVEKITRMFSLVEKIVEEKFSILPKDSPEVTKVIWCGLHGICALSIRGKLDTVGANSANNLADIFIDNYTSGIKFKVNA